MKIMALLPRTGKCSIRLDVLP